MIIAPPDASADREEVETPELSSLSAADRVLLRDPRERAYVTRVARSTVDEHGAAIEAVIEVACSRWRRRHGAYVTYLQPNRHKPLGGTPGNEGKSVAYREAETGWVSVHEALAAALAVIYPHPTQQRAFIAAKALVHKRVGKLCSGWTPHNTTELLHHPDDVCPVHGGRR